MQVRTVLRGAAAALVVAVAVPAGAAGAHAMAPIEQDLGDPGGDGGGYQEPAPPPRQDPLTPPPDSVAGRLQPVGGSPTTFQGDTDAIRRVVLDAQRIEGAPIDADVLGRYLTPQELGNILETAATQLNAGTYEPNELIELLRLHGQIQVLQGPFGWTIVPTNELNREGLVLATRNLDHELAHRRWETDPAYRQAQIDWFDRLSADEQQIYVMTLRSLGYPLGENALTDEAQRALVIAEVQAFRAQGSFGAFVLTDTGVLVRQTPGELAFIGPSGALATFPIADGSTVGVLRDDEGGVRGFIETRPDGISTIYTPDARVIQVSPDGRTATVPGIGGGIVVLTDVQSRTDSAGNLIGLRGLDEHGNDWQVPIGRIEMTVVRERDNANGTWQHSIYDANGNLTFIIDSERGVINPNDGWGGNNPFDASRSGPITPGAWGPGFWGGGMFGGGAGGGWGWGPVQAFAALDALAAMASN